MEWLLGIADGVIGLGLISSQQEGIAWKRFLGSSEIIKKFFGNAIYNITHLNEIVSTVIGHIFQLDTPESQKLNSNIGRKMIGGLIYDLSSGALIKKRHFTKVTNSESMMKKIEEEGLIHFSSPMNIDEIMKSGKIKHSNIIDSDLTKLKSFFFAGVPSFEDLLINIPAYDVMSAVKIKPNKQQLSELRYRALDDRAVVKDGDFDFSPEQVERVWYGLKYNKDKRIIYLAQITEEEAQNYTVCDEVKRVYNYERGKRNSVRDFIRMEAYGLFAQYKHHQRLLSMESVLREKGIRGFEDLNDRSLVHLADIEQAYVDTQDDGIGRENLLTRIKSRLKSRRESRGDDDGQLVQ